jgi:hypothetical protein
MSTEPEAVDVGTIKEVTLAVLVMARNIAAVTPWAFDDTIVAAAISITEKPVVWNLLALWISRQIPGVPEAAPELEAAIAEAVPGIDPVTIIALITTLLPLIQGMLAWWKQRRAQPAPVPTPTV